MARNLPPYDHLTEEDYIDMDISSATTFLCYSISSSPKHSREFEFQMTSNLLEKVPITSPADELFYKGKLLPLHLPPRLQMVEKLLQNSHTNSKSNLHDSFHLIAAQTGATTHLESCNISPTTSCFGSQELNPEDYFFECASSFNQSQSKNSWSKKLKLIRQSSVCLKLKASKAYLMSLFTKSTGYEDSWAILKAKDCSIAYKKPAKKSPFGLLPRRENTVMRSFGVEKIAVEGGGNRRSFSNAIKRRRASQNKSTSTSSSCSSNSSSFSSINSKGHHVPLMLKRSSSVNSEVENSIQGAIAYCKKSQQSACGRKALSDVGLCSLSSPRIADV